MKNCDIISAVFERDKSHNLLNQINAYATMRNQGNRVFKELERLKDLHELLCKLEDPYYQITERDAQILRKYNVLVSPLNPTDKTINSKSFVVTSDFHGYTYPLDKIRNHYLSEYDVVYILGDATDRGVDEKGTGSVRLLLDIMKLSKQYPNRVIYVPGNHDEFLLGYIKSKQHIDGYYPDSYSANLICNGGENTIRELNALEQVDPKVYNELMTWLGKLPLQRVHKYNGKTYVLAHAIFNQRLYDMNPNYCLDDYFKDDKYSESRRIAREVIWFRKDKDHYNTWEMPSADKTMVIGHTREKQTRGKNLDLQDIRGNCIKVHCVDGGIAYDGGMLKYDGGSCVIWTMPVQHNRNIHSNRINNTSIKDPEVIFQDHILDLTLSEGTLGIQKAISGDNPKDLNHNQIKKIVCSPYNCLLDSEVELMRNLYVKTFLFDYILECQYERMQERYKNNAMLITATSVDRFLHGSKDPAFISQNGTTKGNYYNFTSHRNARRIAMAMGPETMEDVLRVYGCKTVDDYVIRKFSKDQQRRDFAKVKVSCS